MSSYAQLTLGTLDLGVSSRNEVDPSILMMFRESEKWLHVVDRNNTELLKSYLTKEYIDEIEDDPGSESPLTIVQYRCSAVAARDRLDLLGFTYEVARASFEMGLQALIERYQGYVGTMSDSIFEASLQDVREVTLDKWLDGLNLIRRDNLQPSMRGKDSPCSGFPPVLRYMLCGINNGWYGFPSYEYRHLVRLLVETVPDSDELVYDLTDLVAAGYIDHTNDLVEIAEGLLSQDFILGQRIIVLTEGNSDRQILEQSLKLLYPHLVDYFHFFDFTNTRIGGGAGELANLVRAFAAADIKHKIVALFDNDTGARSALSTIDYSTLPSTIVLQIYPDIDLGYDYPTSGPSGPATMNVNGLAGSIELYLGQDTLCDGHGELPPIQWRGYDPKLRAYQGEISNKGDILKRFEAKIKACELDPQRIESTDWNGMRLILNQLKSAFNAADGRRILADEGNLLR